MSRRFLSLLLLLLCVAPLQAAHADGIFDVPGAGHDKFLPVTQAYRPTVDFTGDKLALRWQIADGYYLYHHAFKFETATGAAIAAQIPPGKSKNDKYLGHVELYYHSVNITLTPPASPRTFVLAATAQGCAEAGLCYPPHTWYWRVDTAAKTVAVTTAATPPTGDAGKSPPTPDNSGGSSASGKPHTHSWLAMLLFAIIGGSLLNLMPCVFPVLSLKVLGFASHKEEHLAVHGFSYTAGAVLSFVLVAAALAALKAAGQAVGWGFQLQQPWFVAALAYLFFAMGLSLSGFWTFGGSWMGFGNNLTEHTGYSGSFFTGMLATLVASPCTAPFMAPAVGFAATQPALLSLVIFAAVGLGMALPILALCLHPRWLTYIPRPGVWMDRFKQLLAFPLYAAAIWLCWVAGQQTGTTGMMTVLAGALAIAFGLWVWRFGRAMRVVAGAGFALAFAALASPLLQDITPTARAEQRASEGWQPYSPQKLAALRADGKAVFVNATADWCITCLANEKVTLSSSAVRDAFARHHVTYLKADWTHYDPDITALLARFGRNGVPLYVFFPAGMNTHPVVLPQLLRPDTVIAAIDPAAHRGS